MSGTIYGSLAPARMQFSNLRVSRTATISRAGQILDSYHRVILGAQIKAMQGQNRERCNAFVGITKYQPIIPSSYPKATAPARLEAPNLLRI
jgi:hypothetical protein